MAEENGRWSQGREWAVVAMGGGRKNAADQNMRTNATDDTDNTSAGTRALAPADMLSVSAPADVLSVSLAPAGVLSVSVDGRVRSKGGQGRARELQLLANTVLTCLAYETDSECKRAQLECLVVLPPPSLCTPLRCNLCLR